MWIQWLKQRLSDPTVACRACQYISLGVNVALGIALVLIGAGIAQVADLHNDHGLLHSGITVAVLGGGR